MLKTNCLVLQFLVNGNAVLLNFLTLTSMYWPVHSLAAIEKSNPLLNILARPLPKIVPFSSFAHTS